jgi:hypothetical protein
MAKLPDFLFVWGPLAVILVAWFLLRPKYGQQLTESAERSREFIELQKRILSCLEEIKAELKAAKGS